MAKDLVPDELWEIVQPLLPPPPLRRFRYPGRKRIDDRKCLAGILFVMKTGIPWEDLPKEMGCGSGMTCWRRLDQWQRAGVWEKLHRVLLDRLRAADKIDWSRAAVDSSHIRAVGAGEKNRAQLRRQEPARKQAPRPRGRRRHPAGGDPHGRPPPRRHAARPAG